MCGRAKLPEDVSELKLDLKIDWDEIDDFQPRWNAAPTTDLPVVTATVAFTGLLPFVRAARSRPGAVVPVCRVPPAGHAPGTPMERGRREPP